MLEKGSLMMPWEDLELLAKGICPASVQAQAASYLDALATYRMRAKAAPLPTAPKSSVHPMQQVEPEPQPEPEPEEAPKRFTRKRKKPCSRCGSARFWRILGTSKWLCEQCDGPGGQTNIEWND
jgi:hypothetical protein